MTIKHTELAFRAKRFLTEEPKAEDLRVLLLFARDNSRDQRCIQELGHIIAHADKRVKGLCTDYARGMFAWAAIATPAIWEKIDPEHHNSIARYAFAACSEQMSKRNLKPLNLRVPEARKILKSISDKLINFDGKKFEFKSNLCSKEYDILRFSLYNLIPKTKTLFDSNTLINELRICIAREGITTNKQSLLLKHRRHFLSAFAVCAMHGSEIVIDGWPSTYIRAINNTEKGRVEARFEFQLHHVHSFILSFPLFDSKISADALCTPEIAQLNRWDFPIEVNAEGKICRLGV